MTTKPVQPPELPEDFDPRPPRHPAPDPHDLPVLEVGVPDMESAYRRHRLLATSTNADIYLIRSHIAYHLGFREADRARIAPSRGHSYRVKGLCGHDPKGVIIRISDYYDHRDGVTGLIR